MDQRFERLQETLREMGGAFSRVAEAVGCFCRSFIDFCSELCSLVRLDNLLQVKMEQEAIKEAPPVVRHLALHGKKRRTRKKNINRALREYQRRTTSD